MNAMKAGGYLAGSSRLWLGIWIECFFVPTDHKWFSTIIVVAPHVWRWSNIIIIHPIFISVTFHVWRRWSNIHPVCIGVTLHIWRWSNSIILVMWRLVAEGNDTAPCACNDDAYRSNQTKHRIVYYSWSEKIRYPCNWVWWSFGSDDRSWPLLIFVALATI